MKRVDFSKTFAACDLKVGRCRQRIEFMTICEGQCYFLTLAQGHSCMKIKTCFSQKPLDRFNQILYVSFKVHGK